MSDSNIRGPFFIGEIRWLKWNIFDQLDGDQISSVTFTIELPVVKVGTEQIYTRNGTNDSVKCRFDFTGTTAGTRYSITANIVTSTGETIKETIIATVKALPT
jgi:hypothetical protein